MRGVAVDGLRAADGASPAERLALHAVRNETTGCLTFTGAVHDGMGYCRIGIDGRQFYVHRVAFELAYGQVPDGMVVRHSCDNPPCIEPTHLAIGTQADNVQDMVRRGRLDRRGERNNSARLTWPAVREIRGAHAAGDSVVHLADRYGISKSQVRNIIHRHHWKEPSMLTVQQAIDTFSVDVDGHLDRQVEIPVLTGLQFQGDVAVIPSPTAGVAKTPVPAAGYPVVRGEVGGNTHLLLATGRVFFDPHTARDLDLGLLTVPDGSTGYLAHPEHSYAGIGPGTYVIRRQREQADEIRMVAD